MHHGILILLGRHAIENINLSHLLIPAVLRIKCDIQTYKHSLQFNNNDREIQTMEVLSITCLFTCFKEVLVKLSTGPESI